MDLANTWSVLLHVEETRKSFSPLAGAAFSRGVQGRLHVVAVPKHLSAGFAGFRRSHGALLGKTKPFPISPPSVRNDSPFPTATLCFHSVPSL